MGKRPRRTKKKQAKRTKKNLKTEIKVTKTEIFLVRIETATTRNKDKEKATKKVRSGISYHCSENAGS